MFALRDLNPGKVILTEPIVLCVPETPGNRNVYGIHKAVQQADAKVRQRYFQLKGRTLDAASYRARAEKLARTAITPSEISEAMQAASIWDLNAWADKKKTWVALDSSYMNHSCLQNAVTCTDEEIREQSVVAIKPIAAGEEILTSYVPICEAAESRKQNLRNWGFECDCAACALATDEARASEERRKELVGLFAKYPTMASLQDCEKALRLLESEQEMIGEKCNV